MVANLSVPKGYTLVELLIALLISTVLILGISSAYSSITGLINSSKNLENGQEVLRYCSEVFIRSLKQTASIPTISTGQLAVQQVANSIACDGSAPSSAYTETFTLDGNNLTCDIGSGAQVLLTGVESLSFSLTDKLVSVTVEPEALYGESAGVGPAKAVQIDIALSEIILINALGS